MNDFHGSHNCLISRRAFPRRTPWALAERLGARVPYVFLRPLVTRIRGTLVVSLTRFFAILVMCLVCGINVGRGAEGPTDKSAPHLVFLVSEDPSNYKAHKTIPPFAEMLREQHGFRCSIILGKGKPEAFHFPGLAALEKADLLVIFFRRRALSLEQLAVIRNYLQAGKPLVGIRTAHHAFAVRSQVTEGYQAWEDFAPEVLGCRNRGYGPEKVGTDVAVAPEAIDHPILSGVQPRTWHSRGSLYLVQPLVDQAPIVLLSGSVGEQVEPIAWTRHYKKSRVFYTSLGYPDDFQQPQFRRLLTNAIYWTLDKRAK